MHRQTVLVDALVPDLAGDAAPEHPIYIPVEPPPESGLSPEHPIYIPVTPTHPIAPGGPPPEVNVDPMPTPPIFIPVPPPADSGLSPEHPIYIPVQPEHPIVLPPEAGLSDEEKEALRVFLVGNLPPQVSQH